MSIIDFIKKHEKLLQSDSPKTHLTSLQEKLAELQSLQPGYQSMADEIYEAVDERGLSLETYVDETPKWGNEVVGIGSFGGITIDGLRGKVVDVPFSASQTFGIEWEANIGGHNCDGKAKRGHGWRVPRGYLKKVSALQKPDVDNRQDYDNFLTKLRTTIRKEPDLEEYLDYKDKDFKKGDEIQLVRNPTNIFGKRAIVAGDRGTIIRQQESGYFVLLGNTERIVQPDYLAKVKKRKKSDIKVGDKVEVINSPPNYDTKDGSWGYVTKVRTRADYYIYMVKLEHLVKDTEREFDTAAIYRDYLRLMDRDIHLEEEQLSQIIDQIEEEFRLPEYETQRSRLSREISELVEKEIISFEEINTFLESFEDLNLQYSDLHDEELEDLLK